MPGCSRRACRRSGLRRCRRPGRRAERTRPHRRRLPLPGPAPRSRRGGKAGIRGWDACKPP
ncbi:MAG: hypothetical protein E6G94_13205 [Alphaproteobacteria bacterium]|nr:MAG: hypothetical protein E6G94_13205 [Alphaproteobacteria bacterium]